MLLVNGKVLDSSFKFVDANVSINQDKIQAITNNIDDEDVIDCTDCYVVPGLVDIHTHGAKGFDNMDPSYEAINTISKFMAENGVTTFLPTLITQSFESMSDAAKNIKSAMDTGVEGANIGGIYMEGPYFTAKYKGAQNEKFLRLPSIEEFNKLFDDSGKIIKVVSIAPEKDGAIEFINGIKDITKVSIGHTDANYEQASSAIKNGATNLTHTFNAMRGLHHRDPNAIGAAFDSDITCECICDGVHIHPAIVRTMNKIVGNDRMVLVSDSVRATGMIDGTYDLGGQNVNVKDGKATLEDGTIAGSTATLLGCVKKAIEFGIAMENAFKMATINPSKVAGIDNKIGSLEEGKNADILILDKDLNIKAKIVNGKLL